jgi:hypothetical protein
MAEEKEGITVQNKILGSRGKVITSRERVKGLRTIQPSLGAF